jgi:hypothetical protein
VRGDRAAVEVLDEVAAGQDVQQLGAAADSEDRDVGAQRRAQDRQVALVAVTVGVLDVGPAPLAIERGVDVGLAAGQHDRVDADEVLDRPEAERPSQDAGPDAPRR